MRFCLVIQFDDEYAASNGECIGDGVVMDGGNCDGSAEGNVVTVMTAFKLCPVTLSSTPSIHLCLKIYFNKSVFL